MKPPFTYFGGKTSTAARIASLLPPHEHYVEPFAGSLAVLLAKPPSAMETVNDIEQDLMTFWRVLRDQPAELEQVCALTPHSRAEQAACYERNPELADLERARRVWVVLTQGRGGHLWRGIGWRYEQNPRGSSTSMPDYLASYVRRIPPAARRLHGVSLECLPALDLIRRYGQHPAVLIYADPPYLQSTRTSASGNDYGHDMATEAEHQQLAETLHAAKAAVVLSGYHSPLYERLYADWYRTEISAYAGNAAGERRRTEVLWSNRQFPAQQTLLALED